MFKGAMTKMEVRAVDHLSNRSSNLGEKTMTANV